MLFTCRLLTYYLLGVLKQTVLQRFRWNLSFPKKQQLDYLFSNPEFAIVVANGIIVILNIFLKIWILNSWSTKALYKLSNVSRNCHYSWQKESETWTKSTGMKMVFNENGKNTTISNTIYCLDIVTLWYSTIKRNNWGLKSWSTHSHGKIEKPGKK